MVRVLDAVVVTEKAPLVGAHLTQVKGCQRQGSCGRRDQEESQLEGGQKAENTTRQTKSVCRRKEGPRSSSPMLL